MALLRETAPDVRLWLHGANLDVQDEKFRAEFGDLLDAARDNVMMVGRYRPEELPRLMSEIDWVVIPSIWWENSPLVIQEAFFHGRPIICSDIGGMAEKVIDGANGLHFRAGDPRSLARVLHRATTEPGLWQRLRDGIPPVHSMDDHVTRLVGLYDELLDRARPDLGAERDRGEELVAW
jgi:glycosyltransferase involved in cell wall biosynthesis